MSRVLRCRFCSRLSLLMAILMIWPSIMLAALDSGKQPVVISSTPTEVKISIGKGEDTQVGSKGIIVHDGKDIAKFEIISVNWGYSTIKVSDVAPGERVMVGDGIRVTETPKSTQKVSKKSGAGKWLGLLLLVGGLLALGGGGGGGGSSAANDVTITLTRDPNSLSADGTSTATITATVVDANNAAVADDTVVQFAASMGTIAPAQATTTDGVATATLTAGVTAGTCTITATVGSATDDTTITFTASEEGDEGSIQLETDLESIQVLGSGGANTEATITATCLDGQGDPATEGTVTFTTTLGSVVGTATIGAGGIATTTFNSSETGEAEITASWEGAEANVSVTVTAGPPHSINVECAPAAIECDGNAFANVTATVLDIAGNPVTDGTVVTFAVEADVEGGGNGTATPEAYTTDGVATALVYSRNGDGDPSTPGTATVVARVEIDEQPADIPAPIADLENDETQVQFVSQDVAFINVGAETPLLRGLDVINTTTTVTAIVEDSQHNPVPDGTAVYFTVSPHGMIHGASGQAGNVAMSVTQNGLATATFVSDAAGSIDVGWDGKVSITATCGDMTITNDNGALCVGGPAAPMCTVEISKDTLFSTNDSAQISVDVFDRNGNPIIDELTKVTFSTSAGTITPDSVDPTVAGAATATLSMSSNPANPTTAGDGLVTVRIIDELTNNYFEITVDFTVEDRPED